VSADSRRTHIADSAIATLAESGSRGLTHRAVDQKAGLPTGSTSYYLRSRGDLVAACADRLAELDTQALARLPARSPAADLTRLLEGSLHGEGRVRTLARYELTMEAARRPELRATMAAGKARVHAAVRDLLVRLGVDDPDSRADDLMALIDGVLLGEVTGTSGQPRTRRELRATVERFLASAAVST
jgi:DNA-binding transcriptional regulator YbjK